MRTFAITGFFTGSFILRQNRGKIFNEISKRISIKPDECYPSSIIVDDYNNSTRNAISDLEDIECSDVAKYTKVPTSLYVKMLKKKITFDEFLEKMERLSINREDIQLSLFAA